jgi:hypothetical protein
MTSWLALWLAESLKAGALPLGHLAELSSVITSNGGLPIHSIGD